MLGNDPDAAPAGDGQSGGLSDLAMTALVELLERRDALRYAAAQIYRVLDSLLPTASYIDAQFAKDSLLIDLQTTRHSGSNVGLAHRP